MIQMILTKITELLVYFLLEHPTFAISRASISDMILVSDFHYLPMLFNLLPWAMCDCLVVHDSHSHSDNSLS